MPSARASNSCFRSAGSWPCSGGGRGLLEGLTFGGAVFLAMLVLYHAWLKPGGHLGAAENEICQKVVRFGVDNLWKYVALAAFYSLIHSFLEEYYWRWFVFGQLREMFSATTALVTSSLGFALHHVIVLAMYFGLLSWETALFSLAVAVGGAVWAWIYQRSRSLWGAWLSHMLVDAAIFAIGYDMVQPAFGGDVPAAVSEIKSDETVVLYPRYARLDADGKTWAFFVHGLVFEPEADSSARTAAIAALRNRLRVEAGTRQSAILERRLRCFLVDHERGKAISIRIGSRVYRTGESGANGHLWAELRLPVAEARRLAGNRQGPNPWIPVQAVMPGDDKRRFAGRVQLIGRSGLSVISDVDDTIKDSRVTDRTALLANTFLREFRPVPGMADLYRQAAEAGAAFHYVSGSPWQLYRPLAEFCRAEGFPAGSLHLKHFRLSDATVINVLASQETTKRRAIEPILAAFPARRFILVGDSGEQDPEIYAKLARRRPRQVVAVFIRNVTDEAADGRRFRTALQGIDPGRWKLFRSAEELQPLVTELIRTHAAR
jgi:membrane protease YdiL (CAAX protease family)